MKKALLIIICLLLLTGCLNNSNNDKLDKSEMNNTSTENINTKESDVEMSYIKVTINDKNYTLKLENNNTVEEFVNLLPQEFTMNELNDNEKYVYIDNYLSTNEYSPKHIEKGDVMLFGNNCLVIFYKSFNTSYSYTKIGHIDNLDNIGRESITVKFYKD